MGATTDEMLWAIRNDRALSKNAKLAWVMLLARGPDCRPSLRTVSEDCRMSRNTLKEALGELEDAGWLKRSVSTTDLGDSDTYSYVVKAPGYEGVGQPLTYPPPGMPSVQGGGSATDLGGGSATDRGGSATDPEDKPSLKTTSVKEKTTGSQSEPGAKRRRATRIPVDFAEQLRADPANAEWFRAHCPDVGGKQALEEFIDYWKGPGGERGTKLDWVATWRNRMRALQKDAARFKPRQYAGEAEVSWDD